MVHLAPKALFTSLALASLALLTAQTPPPAAPADTFKITLYSSANAPPTPKLEELPLQKSVTQFGITWTFAEPARVGRFVTGDWYVVGPVTIKEIDPKPLFDEKDITDIDAEERKAFAGKYCRNGSVKNLVPDLRKSGFDSRTRHDNYDPALTARLPIPLAPGDSLVSTASKVNLKRSKHYGTATAVAVLTCLKAPAPADAFRPGYTDREQTIYLAHNLKRDLLPKLERPAGTPDPASLVKYFDRPWLEDNIFHESHGPQQLQGYGQGLARRGGDTACVLCLDFAPEQKEPLLIGYLQFGIDLYGMLKAGYTGWEAYGGWNSGHKHPIVLAGVLLGDDKMASPSKTFPKASFQEDEQTAYGRTWYGAPVVFLGHSGVDVRTGLGRIRGRNNWGPYEHLTPDKWLPSQWQSDAYRRCCTSRAWIGTGIAAKLMKLEKPWAHDAFFDYLDRWMTEDESEALKVMAAIPGKKPVVDWAREGQVEIPFHEAMWKKYRPTLTPAPDAWKKIPPTDPPFQKAGAAAPAPTDTKTPVEE